MKPKIIAALTLLVTITPLTVFGKPLPGTTNADTSGCYMQAANGQIINLNSLCGASNHNVSTTSTYQRSSYERSNYERPSYNSSTSGSTREIINIPTSGNSRTDFNEIRQEIDRQIFGDFNN